MRSLGLNEGFRQRRSRWVRGPVGLMGLMLTALLSACAANVRLPPPPAVTAPLSDRYAHYQRHRARNVQVTTVTALYRDGVVRTSSAIDAISLENGATIERAEDLLPLVPPTSRAAERMRDAASYRAHTARAGWTSVGMAGVATGLLVLGGLRPSPVGDANTPMLITGVGFALGAVISGVVAALLWSSHERARVDSFNLYDSAYREQLNLCENDQGIFDCDAPPPPRPGRSP